MEGWAGAWGGNACGARWVCLLWLLGAGEAAWRRGTVLLSVSLQLHRNGPAQHALPFWEARASEISMGLCKNPISVVTCLMLSLLAYIGQCKSSCNSSGMLMQVYKPKSADVVIMRDYVHGEQVKEATLRYGQVDVHKKEFKDKAAKAARSEDKKAAARVRDCAQTQVPLWMVWAALGKHGACPLWP